MQKETRTKTTRRTKTMRTTRTQYCYCLYFIVLALCKIATLRPVVGDEYDHKVIV